MTGNAAKRWCFTINNWTASELQAITDSAGHFDYLCIGRESGESGTPHLQGYVVLKSKLRLNNVKALPGFGRAHLEVSRGTPKEASDYCKKENDWEEYGTLPSGQGKRSEFETLKEWIKAQDPAPTHRDLAENFPSLWGRYRGSVLSFLSLFGRKPCLVQGTLRPWQVRVNEIIDGEADDRKVVFVVDPEGNKGKSWLTRYWYSVRDDVQRLSIGKRDDLAYAVDTTKRVFVFDVPRGQGEFIQYSIFEQLKDRMIFSPKYDSRSKVLPQNVHVVVFMNEEPDRNKMSRDRYRVINLVVL